MCPPPVTATGLYARIKVRPPPDCVLRRLSEQYHITQFTPGIPGVHRPQVVLEAEGREDLLDGAGIDELVWLGEWVVCLLSHADRSAACEVTETESGLSSTSVDHAHHEMLLYGFGQLPIQPAAIRLVDGWAELHLVTTAYPKLRSTISALREAAFDVDLRQVLQSDRTPTTALDEQATLSVVDLSALTERQREVANVALESGYFESEGATASEVATTLNISKSTLSEHLRIVIRKLLSQLLP